MVSSANNSLRRIRSSLRQERGSQCHQSCYQQASIGIFRDFAYVSLLLKWNTLEWESWNNKPKITLQVSDIMGRHSGILFSQALATTNPHHFNTDEVSCYVSSQLHCGNFELYQYWPPERNIQAQLDNIQNKVYQRVCHTRSWTLPRKKKNQTYLLACFFVIVDYFYWNLKLYQIRIYVCHLFASYLKQVL